MAHTKASPELLDLLNQAIARELQVSTQYMLQHGVGAGLGAVVRGRSLAARQSTFVASHSPVWLPRKTLKKVAITEMRHAEAIVERVVVLGGVPTTQANAVTIGTSPAQMLENDREQERGAVQLYKHILDVAQDQGDAETVKLFERILADEEAHLALFTTLLGDG
jgi:bacterioferritin